MKIPIGSHGHWLSEANVCVQCKTMGSDVGFSLPLIVILISCLVPVCLVLCFLSVTRDVIKDKTMRANTALLTWLIWMKRLFLVWPKMSSPPTPILISVADFGEQRQSHWANLTLLVRLGFSGSLYNHTLLKSQLVHQKSKVKYPSLNNWQVNSVRKAWQCNTNCTTRGVLGSQIPR